MAKLLSLSTDTPPHLLDSAETASVISSLVPMSESKRVQQAVTATEVESRKVTMPLRSIAELGGVEARNAVFESQGVALGDRVASRALEAAGIDREQVGALVTATSTGNLVPPLASHLIERLGLRRNIFAVPMNGLGCGGGLRSLAVASRLLREAEGPVLVVCVELPSIWLDPVEPSPEDIATYLTFGDGAAAAVIDAEGPGLELMASGHAHWPDSLHARGARLTQNGWRHYSSPTMPRLLLQHLCGSLEDFFTSQDVRAAQLGFSVGSPRDLRLLESAARRLAIAADGMAATRKVWRNHGNMLSAGIFFALGTLAESACPKHSDLGMLVALGAGITCDMSLVRWGDGIRAC